MNLLKTLISNGAIELAPRSLRELLNSSLGEGWSTIDLERAVQHVLQGKVIDEATKQLTRALTKTLDTVIAEKVDRTSVADRTAIANALAAQGAAAMVRAAELLLAYPQAQQAVELAREKGKDDGPAIKAREDAQRALLAAFREISRAVQGDVK